jgi:glutaryl-CoA dehydrogenase
MSGVPGVDYYEVEGLLSEEERMARDVARVFTEEQILPSILSLESVFTCEGTHHIHTLILGRDITGISALK